MFRSASRTLIPTGLAIAVAAMSTVALSTAPSLAAGDGTGGLRHCRLEGLYFQKYRKGGGFWGGPKVVYRPTKFKLGDRIRFIARYTCSRNIAVVDIKVNVGRGNRTVQTIRLKKGINRILVSKSFRSGHSNRYLVTFVTLDGGRVFGGASIRTVGRSKGKLVLRSSRVRYHH